MVLSTDCLKEVETSDAGRRNKLEESISAGELFEGTETFTPSLPRSSVLAFFCLYHCASYLKVRGPHCSCCALGPNSAS